MTKNEKTVTVKITRRQLIDLMLACSWISGDFQMNGSSAEKWDLLHERLQECLKAHDLHEEGKK